MDIKTAFLIWGTQAVTLACLALTAWLHDRTKTQFLAAGLGFALHGGGVMLIALRDYVSPLVIIYMGSPSIFLAFAAWMVGLLLFSGKRVQIWVFTPLLVWFFFIIQPSIQNVYANRATVHQFATALAFIMMTGIIAKSRLGTRKYRHLLSFIWLAFAANSCWIAVMIKMINANSFSDVPMASVYSMIGIFLLVCGIVILAKIAMDENQKYLAQLAITDTLTGALNRRGLVEGAQKYYAKGRSDQLVALIVFDLDFFKHINDSFGHQAGDTVLASFAKLTKGIIGERGIFARSGGEEFSAILQVNELREAAYLCEQIRQMVATTPVATDSGVVRLTVSIGLSAKPASEFNFDNLMSRADTALYKAKAEGRNRIGIAKDHTIYCLTPSEENGTPKALDREADRQVQALRRLTQRNQTPLL